MTRIGKVLVAAMLVLPAAAQAQRPGNTMHTRSAELYLDRAEKASHDEDKVKLFKEAMEHAMEAVKGQPNNPKSWFVLGRVYAATGDAVGADSAFDKAETMYPDYVKETDIERQRAYVNAFNAGVTALQKNDLAGAESNMEAAAAVYNKKPAAALNLGNIYAKANDPDKAAAAYRRALEVLRNPENTKILPPAEQKQWQQWEQAAAFNLAQILAVAGKNDEAVQAYVDYLKRDPNNVTAISNLALVYARAGKTAEAQKLYQQLLSLDLSDEDYFLAGVGLFRANQYATASEAFRKSISKNPAMRDAYYNLAQSEYSQIAELEDQRAKVATDAAAQKALDAKLKPMYQDLIDISLKARDLDPNNRNVLALLARGYRGMVDVVPTAEQTAWKEKTLGVMEVHQGMPYEVTDVALLPVTNAPAGNAPAGGDTYKLTGNVVNLKGTEGQPVKLTFSFLDKTGAVVGTQDVTVAAPKVEAQTAFSATFKSDKPLGGWKYVIAK